MGHVEDILLRYDPGETSETAAISCPGGARIAEGVFVARWSTFFFGTHAEEIWSKGYAPVGTGQLPRGGDTQAGVIGPLAGAPSAHKMGVAPLLPGEAFHGAGTCMVLRA